MDSRDERELLESIGKVALAGGEIIKGAHAGRKDVSAKAGHANFVTVYDEKVQAFVMEALRQIVPEAHFVGEEDGKEIYTEEDRHGLTFVIDPIDGTSNFMKGLETSVISIGLLKDGKPWLGAICNPYREALFTAAAGRGAWKNGERIESSRDTLEESLIMFGTAPYYSELRDMSFDLAKRYMDHCIDVRRFGAAAWDFCLLADGKLGMFFEMRLGLWDYCAGALIAREAGCRVTNLLGRELAFDGPSSIAAVSAGAAKAPYLPEDLFGVNLPL